MKGFDNLKTFLENVDGIILIFCISLESNHLLKNRCKGRRCCHFIKSVLRSHPIWKYNRSYRWYCIGQRRKIIALWHHW